MLRTYHRRVFVLSYQQEDLPMFQTDEELTNFHATLGRMVMYGLYNEAPEDTIRLVTAHLTDKGNEVCAGYHQTIPAYPERWEDGSIKVMDSTVNQVDNLLTSLQEKAQKVGRIFVMAAVRCGKAWGLHS